MLVDNPNLLRRRKTSPVLPTDAASVAGTRNVEAFYLKEVSWGLNVGRIIDS